MLKDIENGLKKISEAEKKILSARHNGISFCEMQPELTRSVIDQIMIRGAAIYGCILPQTEFFATFIAEELERIIVDFGYGELTEAELILALRLNCISGVKFPSGLEIDRVVFTGVTFNINFISSVLENYMRIRNCLDNKFKNSIDGYE